MNRDEYYKNLTLVHSAKGTSWSKKATKYIDKIKTNKGWRYIYKNTESVAGKAQDSGMNALNKVYSKATSAWANLTKDNEYITDDKTYNKKIATVKNSDEWKNIVKSKDPEYTKKDDNGNTTYDIDSYLVKKKHPGLDLMDDVVNGRKLSTNKITAKSTIAGVDDYIKTGLHYYGLLSNLLMSKFKMNQGSYKDEKASINSQIDSAVNTGSTAVKTMLKTSNEVSNNVNKVAKASNDIAKEVNKIDTSDYEKVINTYAKKRKK